LAELRWPRRFFVRRVRRMRGVAAEGASPGLRVRQVPPAGIGHRRHGVSSDADRPREVVSCRLSDGPRQAWCLGQIPAAGTGGGLPDGLDHGAQVASRGDRTSLGRSTANPDKSLVVAAVEKVPAPKNRKRKHGHAVKRQHGFFAGNARIAVLPAATGAELGAFLKANVEAKSHLLTDGFAGYRGSDAALGEHLRHTPVIQDEGANAGEFFPIIHTLFSNIKAWLVGTHHGVSAKHLPRYLREWSYRFNRRNLPDGLDGYLIRRAVECATITYDQLKTGTLPGGASRVRRLPAAVVRPALAG
jgi:transposase-like protein